MAVEYRDRMSESDALLWNNERDPMLRSTILCVMLLDRAPDEARFPLAIERALARIPRLRQRVVLDPLSVAPPRWSLDPHFGLAYHVRRIGAPGKGALRELLDLAAPIGMQAFDKDRPLWELYLVEGIEEGGCALLLKLHHSISDVTAFSYDGELHLGVNTDPAAVREPELFVECLERGVAEVLSVG